MVIRTHKHRYHDVDMLCKMGATKVNIPTSGHVRLNGLISVPVTSLRCFPEYPGAMMTPPVCRAAPAPAAAPTRPCISFHGTRRILIGHMRTPYDSEDRRNEYEGRFSDGQRFMRKQAS
jgi:hypothetical protein